MQLAQTHRTLLAYSLLVATGIAAQAETVATCGKGWLELMDGNRILHLRGTHYEMGYQHGVLLREHVQQNVKYLIDVKGDQDLVEVGPLKLKPRKAIEAIVQLQRPFVPPKYFDELRGLAEGSQLPLSDIQVTNFVPEMFHCSGFAIMNSATPDGTMYHGRVLDYATDWRLQDHAVVIVAEPDDGVPFVNVGYAGFIGSVTGMNAQHVAIGEMGGGGLGHWSGVPMSFLVREVLEGTKDLDEAIRVFRDSPRTCEYFYIISDGKTNQAVGMEASWDTFTLVRPGQGIDLLPKPVEDAVLLSAGDRYDLLVHRVQEGHGSFNAKQAIHLMDRPVSMSSNLHNVLFEPASTRFWVANAAVDGSPAAEQKYQAYRLSELLGRQP